MLLKEIIMVALGAIRANLLRSALTTLGIVIGVAAVIAMVALGEGAQQNVEAQIQRMGTNVLTVRPGQSIMGGIHMGGGGGNGGARLTLDDAEALRTAGGGRLSVTPEASSRQQLSYLRWNSSNEIAGVWPEYFEIYDHELIAGRVFTRGEVEGRRRVAVLGNHVPEDLGTPPEVLVGKTIQIRGQPVEVIGVLAEKGDASWIRPDDQVFVPVSTGIYRLFGGRDYLRSIYTAAASTDELDYAFGEIDRVLRREHRIEPGADADFNISNAADLLEARNESNAIFGYLLAGIAGVSLLVGGIGIMNIMLVSVTERTREVGVRKALGATRSAVLLQFLIEALVLCSLGGALGVAVGWGASTMITDIAGWDTAISIPAVFVALGSSAAIGIFFGIWPARRAAMLDPIDALRHE